MATEKDFWPDWEEKHLGGGSFGVVKLWHNQSTGEKVAVKVCRVSLDTKDRGRWDDEVRRMQELDHPNVVSTRPVPEPVWHLHRGETVLSMEYCSGGDLRRIIRSPSNCCGLPSRTVLQVLRNVSAALEYLHSQRIMHRDLKPENVVLQPDPKASGKKSLDDPYHEMTYKLIDLGYAKKLDIQSLADSFVGTIQYLAPELLESKTPYSYQVDFWSLGTLAFEIMVGRRPFFPGVGLAFWYHKITEKKPVHICGYDDLVGGKESSRFSEDLPRPTRLCDPLRDRLVPWLQSMLRLNPKERGGYAKHPDRSQCFLMLEDILSTPLVRVFSVHKMKVMTYAITELNDSPTQLRKQLEKDVGIPVEQQELLTGTGVLIKDSEVLSLALSKLSPDKSWLFLIPLSSEFSPSVDINTLPSVVQLLWADASARSPNAHLRQVFGQTIFACEGLAHGLQRLVQAYNVSMLHLLRLNVDLERCHEELVSSVARLKTSVDCILNGAEIQLEQLKLLRNVPPNLEHNVDVIRRDLEQQRERALQWRREGFDVSHVSKMTAHLQSRVVELQRSPFSEHPDEEKEMGRLLKCTHDLYAAVKHKDEKAKGDGREMQTLLRKCFERCDRFIGGFVQQWAPLLQCRADIQEFVPSVRGVHQKVANRLLNVEDLFAVQHAVPWQLLRMHLDTSRQGSAYLAQPADSVTGLVGAQATEADPLRLQNLLAQVQSTDTSESLMNESRALMTQLSEIELSS